jgi:Fe-S cluster biogenesis protein NfuA
MNILTTIARATTRRVGSRQLSATCQILSQQTRNYASAKKKSNNNMKINNNNKSPFKSVFGASSTATTLSNKFEIHQENTRSIFIQVESTPNPETLKFVPGTVVLENGTFDFPTAKDAIISPLAKRLFKEDGVQRVFLGPDFISVTKAGYTEWEFLKPVVFATLMEFFNSGEKVIEADSLPKDTQVRPEDDEVVQMIKELLDTRIRPSVQDDGGDIQYMGYVDSVVFVKMQGSCSGCPSSSATLKGGIERMFKHWIPEIQGVVPVEDEASFATMIGDRIDGGDLTAKENYERGKASTAALKNTDEGKQNLDPSPS